MDEIDKLNVFMLSDGREMKVGELVLSDRKIFFRFHSGFLDQGLDISPIKLPLSKEILSGPAEPFDGLFGVFNDSLPDGWGRLLLDRLLSSKGLNIGQLTALDRLAHVGSGGMGALIYKPEIEKNEDFSNLLELDVLAGEMGGILQGASSDIIEELYTLGGSSGGARPKIFAGFNPNTNDFIHGTQSLPQGYEDWIIKFPSSSDGREIANIEFAYHKMALVAGLEMSECKLFLGKSGQEYFGTKRFDRKGGHRIHIHSASGLMHDNFRMSTMDYGHLMDCAFQLEKQVKAHEKVFRLAAFNVFAHNRDDHSKNFSFLMDSKGKWRFAPAYDLTFSYSSYGHHSTMVAGESKNPGKKELMKLAVHFGIGDAEKIMEEVLEAIGSWKEIAMDCGVSRKSRESIQKVMNKVLG